MRILRTNRTHRTVVSAVTGLAAFVIAFAAMSLWTAVSATDAPPSEHPQDWIDESTGRIDVDRVPERVKLATDLAPSGVGWIDPGVVFPLPDSPAGEGPFDVYADEQGEDVIAWMFSTGELVPVGSDRTAAFESAPTSPSDSPPTTES